MTTKHTPAQWAVDELGNVRTMDTECTVATLNRPFPGWEANARLIAAAPKLLGACKDARFVLTLIKCAFGHLRNVDEPISRLESAIREAKEDENAG